MKRKAVFFDIDGTLLPQGKPVPDSTCEAIEKLVHQGHVPILCTGRSRAMVFEDVTSLPFAGIVAAAGTYCEAEGQVFCNHLLEQPLVAQSLEYLRTHAVSIVGEGPGYIYMDEAVDPEDRFFTEEFEKWAPRRLKAVSSDMEINKMTARILDMAHGQEIFQEIRAKLDPSFQVICHESMLMEFIPRPFSKAAGIEAMLTHLGIAQEDTIAFGDSENDVEMLQFVHTGVAMGNGTDRAKEAADLTTADILEDGIYIGLKDLGLI